MDDIEGREWIYKSRELELHEVIHRGQPMTTGSDDESSSISASEEAISSGTRVFADTTKPGTVMHLSKDGSRWTVRLDNEPQKTKYPTRRLRAMTPMEIKRHSDGENLSIARRIYEREQRDQHRIASTYPYDDASMTALDDSDSR